MIDIDKCKAAFATTPLCQRAFYQKGEGNSPSAMCALTALVSYAGVHADLIALFNKDQHALLEFAYPVLKVAYGIPHSVSREIPMLFDNQENEWKAVVAVLEMFEEENKREEESAKNLPMMAAWPSLGANTITFEIAADMAASSFDGFWTTWTPVVKKAKTVKPADPEKITATKENGEWTVTGLSVKDYITPVPYLTPAQADDMSQAALSKYLIEAERKILASFNIGAI